MLNLAGSRHSHQTALGHFRVDLKVGEAINKEGRAVCVLRAALGQEVLLAQILFVLFSSQPAVYHQFYFHALVLHLSCFSFVGSGWVSGAHGRRINHVFQRNSLLMQKVYAVLGTVFAQVLVLLTFPVVLANPFTSIK